MKIVSIDLAFRRHSSAAIAMGVDEHVLRIVDVAEWRPTKDRPLVPSDVLSAIVSMARAHDAEAIAGDIHYRDLAIEHARDAGLGWLDIDNQPEELEHAYIWLRYLLRERRVAGLSTDTEAGAELVRQLRDTRYKALPGGRLRPVPARGHGHGDLVSALVGGAQVLREQLLAGPTETQADTRMVDDRDTWRDPWDDEDDDDDRDGFAIMRRM